MDSRWGAGERKLLHTKGDLRRMPALSIKRTWAKSLDFFEPQG